MIRSLLFFSIITTSVLACTAFQVKSQDGGIIYCRSMEFGFPMQSEVLVVSRNATYTGTAPNNQKGMHWRVKYGFVGMNQSFLQNYVNDGMNERGLVVGCLYLPGYAKYEAPNSNRYDHTLAAWELPTYLLSTCATVKEVKEVLPEVLVAEQGIAQFNGFVLPIHFQVCDATGACIVIEFVDGICHVHNNPLAVLTNSPPFDWQMTHLMGYVNLTAINVSNLQLRDYKVPFWGQGSGLLGLPGDYSPASRFVRAAFFSSFAGLPKTAVQAVRLGFHILNTFDIFEGVIRPSLQEDKKGKIPSGVVTTDITQWVIAHDLINRKTYFRTYDGLIIQMVDLKMIDFSEGMFRQIPTRKDFFVEDVTDNARPLLIKS